MNKLLRFLCVIILGGLCSCEADRVEPTANALANFDHLWGEFDQRYGVFEAKQIDWNALRATYRPRLTPQAGDGELYQVLTQMLEELNDNHVSLLPTTPAYPRYVSGQTRGPALNHTSLEVIKNRYLTDYQMASPTLSYGKLPGNIGYVYLSGFDESFANYEHNLDRALQYLQGTKGMVLDIRNNAGGRDELAQYIAGRFAAGERRLYMKSRKRNGPRQDQFAAWQAWYVQPTGKSQYTQPIILLTSDDTISAGETFTLAMKRQPHVQHVGLTTSGAFSDRVERDLPNGWRFTISVGDYRDHNNVSWEGRGLTPAVAVANTAADQAAQRDPMLENAIQLVP